MGEHRPPSWVLVLYYTFLLVTTGLSYGYPYPLFGVLLTGGWARAAFVADCLVLLHIVLGVWKAQRLTWYLLLCYNAFELVSLLLDLVRLDPKDLAQAFGGDVSVRAFYAGALIGSGLMILATAHAIRLRHAFSNRDPYLF